MHTGAQKVHAHGIVRLGGHHDAHRIDLPQQLAVVGERLAPQGSSHGVGHIQAAVDHSHELTAFDLGVLLGMELAQIAHPNDGATQRFHRVSFQ